MEPSASCSKYFKRNFLAGRWIPRATSTSPEQLQDPVDGDGGRRALVHGTTHERPVERGRAGAVDALRAGARRAGRSGAKAPLTRVVATDYLVSVDTQNRYSVPFTLIGQPVEVRRRDGRYWRCGTAARWSPRIRCSGIGTSSGSSRSTGRVRDLCAQRTAGGYSTGECSTGAIPLDVEVRDLACYEAAYGLGGAE